jgi:two-component system NarL family sensor kinase
MKFSADEITTGLVVVTILIFFLSAFVIFIVYRHFKYRYNEQSRLNTLKAEHSNAVMAARTEMQELTFQMIAREIHDNISLSLTHSIQTLDKVAMADTMYRNDVNKSIEYTTKALDDLSHLSKSLNPDLIKRHGFLTILEKEVNRLKSSEKYEVAFVTLGNTKMMDPERELLLFRIIQESMNNFIKHAAAKRYSITLDYRHDELLMEIFDDGKGFIYPIPADKERGAGIDTIENRIKVLNGELSIATGPGLGTLIKISIPYQ